MKLAKLELIIIGHAHLARNMVHVDRGPLLERDAAVLMPERDDKRIIHVVLYRLHQP